MSKKYYIGIRESDYSYSTNYFENSISMFSNSYINNQIRPNQNKSNKEFIERLLEKIKKIINQDSNARFMFYNNKMAYLLPEELHPYFICCNEKMLLESLNDKIICKSWLIDNNIPTMPYETVLGKEIIQCNIADFFKITKKFVIQNNCGGGGIGTFVLSQDNFYDVIKQLLPLKEYIISPYIANSISVNTHVFVSKSNVVLSPGSIQINEIDNHQICYRGADYFSFQKISTVCKQSIKDLSIKIANLLRMRGYRGVAGIDFLINENGSVYCAEINPRFQASSILLDRFLSTKENTKSIFELNEQAFTDSFKTDLAYEDKIEYSCYYYYNSTCPKEYFKMKQKILSEKNVTINMDGLSWEKNRLDNDSYLFSAIFTHPICDISPDYTLWIDDNITVQNKPATLLELKIALLNQGVRINHGEEHIKKGVYESVDITFIGAPYCVEPIDINCAYQINLTEYSPYELDCHNGELYYYNEKLGIFNIEYDLLKDLEPKNRKILYLATDRLRIKLISGCEYKKQGRGCAFCNLPPAEHVFTLNDIIHALEVLKMKNVDFKHILIGGGTYLSDNVWLMVEKLCDYLKHDNFYKNKPISLMSILPPIKNLQKLKDSGITEVAFNLEISDSYLAKKYMPGKHYDKNDFYERIKFAVKIFGQQNVRSAIIVGFDKEEDLLTEVMKMASIGVIPCLSIFRYLPQSEIVHKLSPTNKYLHNIYIKCLSILDNSNYEVKTLGPNCRRCRNNMLHI